METVTLKIKNKSKFQHFLTFIKDLDYVEVLKKEPVKKKKNTAEENDFFALAGMWENRDISAEDLRSKAWPKRK
ncbi:MAG: hypothetical protein KAR17_09985 [Cyclobacteriaceae bacterium]|nr:hypothetical protein [Cyclobacteriaceae bacterium]MCK5279301.1 hypothetical protein [Cyclobacteriaceae bacterium]